MSPREKLLLIYVRDTSNIPKELYGYHTSQRFIGEAITFLQMIGFIANAKHDLSIDVYRQLETYLSYVYDKDTNDISFYDSLATFNQVVENIQPTDKLSCMFTDSGMLV